MSVKIKSPRPHFYRGFKLLQLALLVYMRNLKLYKKDKNASILKSKKDGILSAIRLRKKLVLTKIVKYNNMYYSTPTIPGFPSEPFDNSLKNGGLNFYSAGTPMKKQIDSLFLAVTDKCVLNCRHCYEKQNINKNSDVGTEKWKEIISLFQNKGTSIIILTGGEPLYDFNKTLDLLSYGDKSLSDFHLHTSGMTVTRKKVKALKSSGLTAAAVGLDHYIPAKHDEIRGRGSFDSAVQALELFSEEGVMTYVNLCATKDLIRSGGLWKYFGLVKKLNVSFIQLLEPRPCGGFFGYNSDALLSPADKKYLLDFTITGNSSGKYGDFPVVYYVAHIEGKEQLGCHMGGLSLLYIDSFGNVCPCVFFPVSFGNILNEDTEIILNRMRKNIPGPIRSDCPSLKFPDTVGKINNDLNSMPLPYSLLDESIKNILSQKSK